MPAGWNVRVTTFDSEGKPESVRYFLAYEPDKERAVELVRKRVPVNKGEEAEAVAEVAGNEFVGQNMRPGDVRRHAEAAKMSNAERVALEKATAACKVEAKGMKFSWHWRKRQKYVQNCIIRTVNQEGVSIDIWQVRSTVNMKGLRPQRPGEWGCDPMC